MNAATFARHCYLEKKRMTQETFAEGPCPSAANAKIRALHLDDRQTALLKEAVSLLLTDAYYTLLLGLAGSCPIGDAEQQTYRLYDEADNLLTGNGDLEAAAYAYCHEGQYEQENPSDGADA